MSEEQVKELFGSRNKHDTRITALEIGFTQIKDDVREIKDVQREGFAEIQRHVQETRDIIIGFNGKPNKNEQKVDHCLTEINQIKTECKVRGAQQKGFLSGIRLTTVVIWVLVCAFFALIGFFIANREKFVHTNDGVNSSVNRAESSQD